MILPHFEEYVIVAQAAIEITAFWRGQGCQPMILGSVEATLELRSIWLALPLAQIYGGEEVQRI